MKIAFIVHDYHRWGGHSRYVAELSTRFSREHEVHVFANEADRGEDSGIVFHHVPALRTNVMTTLFSFAISSALHMPKGFDVVHSQGFCGPAGNVITTHICNEAWRRSLRRFGVPQSGKEKIFHFCASFLERRMYRNARHSHVIAISRRIAADIVELYQCPSPIHTIYHGVDLETFSPYVRGFSAEQRQRLGIGEGETVFLYVGDLRKGARECIRALARLEQGRLMLVSRSSPQPYRELAREAGVLDRVHLLPPTNRVHEFYGAADALLLPSPYDAFAMVVTEAMACALPVIVSREAGASELVEHRRNGLLLEDPANDGELAEHMSALQRDSQWAEEIGRSARRTVERLSWDAVAAETMRVYEQAISKPIPVRSGEYVS